MAGQYECELYSINGLVLESRKRREHLSRDDLQKNKAMMESLTKGGGHGAAIDQNGEVFIWCSDESSHKITTLSHLKVVRRASLLPPPDRAVTWEQYINADPGEYDNLGRDLVYKESSKSFKATVAMVSTQWIDFWTYFQAPHLQSRDFPLTIEMLLNVLEVIAPLKHLSKLRDFVALKLPSGFPVKIDIPILPTVSAKITFQTFEFRDNISPLLFDIPEDYTEDSMRYLRHYTFSFLSFSTLFYLQIPWLMTDWNLHYCRAHHNRKAAVRHQPSGRTIPLHLNAVSQNHRKCVAQRLSQCMCLCVWVCISNRIGTLCSSVRCTEPAIPRVPNQKKNQIS